MLAINKNQLRARSWFSRQQRCVELRQYKHGTKGILTIFVYRHGCEASEPGMRHPARLGRRVRRASCSDALLEESQSKSGNAAMPRIYHRKSACAHHSAACSDARSPRVRKGHKASAAAGIPQPLGWLQRPQPQFVGHDFHGFASAPCPDHYNVMGDT